MNHFNVDNSLKNMVVLVDTREQDTVLFRKRIKSMQTPTIRCKLNFGDYSAKCTLPNGEEYSLANKVAVERKMGIDELCICYSKERSRFIREFERAKEANAKIHLLVENASIENVLNGNYRSKLHPNALLASMAVWTVRYNCIFWQCKPETSGRLIREILYRELKESLMRLDYESAS